MQRKAVGAAHQALRPAIRAGAVLWLELTGSFFALLALAMAVEAWKRRADFTTPGTPRLHAILAATLLCVFTWFAASSFLRAARHGRG